MVRAKQIDTPQNELHLEAKNCSRKSTNGRKSLVNLDQKVKTDFGASVSTLATKIETTTAMNGSETKLTGRKSLPPIKNSQADDDLTGSDEEPVDSIGKLDLQYAKLNPTLTPSCAHLPSSLICEECGFSNGVLIECQGSCQRAFHLECLGQTDEIEPIVTSAPSKDCQIGDFKCDECQNDHHICFACKLSFSNDLHQVTKKCSVASCGKFYHEKCMKSNELFRKDASWTPNKPAYICPQHLCNTCWIDSKTNKSSDLLACTRGRFIKCMMCPIAYHQSEFCLAAGSKIFNTNQIICPSHFKQIKNSPHHNRVNVSWCFVCCETGDLIGCSRCPAAYHESCLKSNDARYMNLSQNKKNEDNHNKNANQGNEEIEASGNETLKIGKENWVCEDCVINKRPLYGEIVWAKVGNYRWWPAQICLPRCLENPTVRSIQCLVGEFVVKFFGTFDFYSINLGRCFTFAEGDEGGSSRGGSLSHTSGGNTLMRAFTHACHQAKLAYKEVERLKLARVPKTSTNKYNFQMIKTNRPYGKVVIPKVQIQDIPRCDCSPNEVAPCGSDSNCMNRMLKYECHPLVCPAGPRCLNQRFTKREYPKQEPVGAGDRGWGLRTLVDIKKGDFVNEYVGEIIDEDECKRRMEYAHANKITNFYFLTIDKERIIDAGPKGNLARFANHSCEPNMETQKWVVNGDVRVGLFACKDISVGSELTFNYQLDCLSNQKAVCKCGSKNCAGYIGDRPKPIQNQSNGSSSNMQTSNGGVVNNNRKRKISEVVETSLQNQTKESNLKKVRNSIASISRVKSHSKVIQTDN